MTWSWDRRIERASELSSRFPESSMVLSFYSHIARFQKVIAEALTMTPQTSPGAIAPYFPDLLAVVSRHGTQELSEYARGHLSTLSAQEDLLVNLWGGNLTGPESARFFARALLQPFAEALARRGAVDTQTAAPVCPFCSAKPVAGILRGEGEGAKRSLLCSLCATEWQYRRIVCPNCGEEERDRLPIYGADEIAYVRVDACDTCRTFIKSVDLTKDGLAVPVVDELASLSLTIWAEDNGYTKSETNLLGM